MKIYNTLTRQKEELKTIKPNEVKIYACGPTVYNYIHIGNARPICIFDILRRYLEYRGYQVTFVQNFTDIDDKIINKANEEGADYLTVALRYIDEYKKDAEGLQVHEATIHPKATENMDEIIRIVKRLSIRATLTPYKTATFTSARISSMNTASFPISRSRIWRRARVLPWEKLRKTQWILPCGNQQSPASQCGKPPGAKAVPAGISSALPWHGGILGIP